MSSSSELGNASSVPLQFLLFIDDRPNSQDSVQEIGQCLTNLLDGHSHDLQILQISKHPHLVEHFRLVATPSLIKLQPEPRQVLAGSNIIQQLQKWWPRWQQELAMDPNPEDTGQSPSCPREISSVGYSGELMKMSDELFLLKKDKEELLQQIQFKDQILAMLAHDLRSPLTAASIAVDTLELLQHKPIEEQKPALRSQLLYQARKQFKIMDRLIEDILQASKNLNSQFQVHGRPLAIADLCQEVLELYQAKFSKKNLTITYDIPKDLPNVFADEELIRQVIANLLDNAIKYTPAHGSITVGALHRTTQKVQVSITDNGPGIPNSKQETIFEGHFRLQRDEQTDGYGLGLSLCRKIIQAHYGQIWVDSRPKQGSSFHFTLPVYR
ncbi:sensory transduction histidine kinase [Synechocystis sp. PCC 6803]|uniref:Adaptive-response sensory kinase SasA n=1 Tax=Synechocystis sp. (strain ATCC 27184 / PCC 6803 / Kazusa) TaxID=1111708 RepID=SASA_SYNY3|nr:MULTISPECIES: histidine kinase [unclassified Synechocystis]Q55630.1 RecName: Full=Adaptive-response sensory kinase SasA; AltName: Full=Sensor histidine kinase Hik8; AltName: Full=Sensor histidine kinase SasA [Synechocystis sp. PCC 6803 substr. Kazusa]BAM54517.1 adaptive-response sensory kinase [Synechocystis sp. PCC 6803] [Bacillus subtilis BEST7613]AGF52436.1 sensory transduction histidine kinase [Synechocystis sp. PCC 6803]ALJ68373.1 histidine kinase [Synechocystis sp. PCC 6803]AVP90211.1